MAPWSAQGMSVAQITGLAFTSEDRVRDVLHDFKRRRRAPRSRLRDLHPPGSSRPSDAWKPGEETRM
jgi:hypothetical protein